ncbi:MAG: histidine phosphatase family protein [Lachnospiraceae bacterium]
MELVWIRHFKTKGNKEQRYIGVTDESLEPPENEMKQRHYPAVEEVIASPMKRCVETAYRIYQREPLWNEKLRECDFGRFENHNYEELKQDKDYQAWLASSGKIEFPQGESRQAFQKRSVEGVIEVIDLLLEKGIQKAALVVHGGTIMAAMEVLGIPKKEFYDRQVDNGGGYITTIDEKEWKKGNRQVKEVKKL